MNFASFKNALGKAYETAASTAAIAAKDIQAQVVGARCLREYNLQGQVATGGLHGVWKIFVARSRKEGTQNRVVSVWILDKRPPASLGGGSSGHWEAVVDLCRKDAAALTRLKHPAIVKILEPMEETRTQLIIVTEAIFASSLDLLNRFESVPGQRQQVRLSELEVKAGLLQVADGLQFLHHEANLVHRGLSPGVVLLTAAGSWKLAGLALAVRAQFGNSDDAAVKPFDFTNSAPPSWLQLTQAPLAYVAPELTGYSASAPGAAAVTPAADIFSLGALMHELVAGKQLLPVGSSLGEYQAKLASMHLMDFSGTPPQLVPTLKAMLSTQPAARPNANAVAGAPYFQEDVVVRALRFLEGFLQRDALQKAAFLKDLESLWPRCDARVLRYRVLPPLLAESRSEALQPVILPLIMRIIQQQDPQDFADYTLPALAPLCTSANGQALFQLTRFADILYTVMLPQNVEEVLIPLLARAADIGDARTQEEMLKKTTKLAEKADYNALKTGILPRAQRLCLATTSAAVRQAAFHALTALAPRFDKEVATSLVATLQQVLKVDRSSGTVAGALTLGQALVSSWGPIFGAEYVLPVLSPCLAAPGLSREQFREVFKAIEEILHSIASSRVSNLDADKPTVCVSASGDPQISAKDSLPPWDKGPSTSWAPTDTAPAEQSIKVPVPVRHNPGKSSNAAYAARSTPSTPSTPPTSGPFTLASSSFTTQPPATRSAPGSSSFVSGHADPFSMPSSNAPMQIPGGANTTIDWLGMTMPKPVQAAHGQSDDLFAGMSMLPSALPAAHQLREPDPFADWPPASNGGSGSTSTPAVAGSMESSNWQPSFPHGSSTSLHTGGHMGRGSRLSATQGQRGAVTRPPKLAPPPGAIQKQQHAAPKPNPDSTVPDSLI